MRRRLFSTSLRRAFGVALGLLLLSPSMAGPLGATPNELQRTLPQAGLPSERETWRRLETPSFTILSSASPQRTVTVARQLEGLAAAIGHVTRLEADSPLPTTIYLFADNASLHPYKHLYDGEPASMSGALYARPWGDYIAMNGARRAEASITVFHEYMHVVLRNNLPDLPLWLEEGLAELFSTFRLGERGGRLGKPVPWHLDELKRGELVPLRRILEAGVSSELYNRFEHQGEFYARSWELVHFLMIGRPQRLDQALDFLSRTFQGQAIDTAFKAAFGLGIDALDRELAAYRADGYPSILVRLPPIDLGRRGLEKLTYPEVLLHLGELLASQGGREGDAGFHFRQALQRRPDFAPAVTGLGLLALGQNDLPRARALFARAVSMSEAAEKRGEKRGPGPALEDPRAHYFYGRSLLTLGRAVSLEKRKEARRHLERSVALDPSFAPAWVALALARHLEAPRGETGDAPSIAPEASPRVALDILMLHSRSRQRDAARRLWKDYFEPRPESPERRAAARILERLDWLERGGEPPNILRPPAASPPPPPPNR